MTIRPTDIVDLRWKSSFGSLLTSLDLAAANDGTTRITNDRLTARALLHLLQEGKRPSVQEVFDRIVSDDEELPGGGRLGFDQGSWFASIQRVAAQLRAGATHL